MSISTYARNQDRSCQGAPVIMTAKPWWGLKMRPRQEKDCRDSAVSRPLSMRFRGKRPRNATLNRRKSGNNMHQNRHSSAVIPLDSLERFPLLPQHRRGDFELQDFVGAFIDAANADVGEVPAGAIERAPTAT